MTRKVLVSTLYLSVDGGGKDRSWYRKLGRGQAERVSSKSRAWV